MKTPVPFEVRSLAALIVETGFRLPDLIKLEWRDVDLAEGVIRAPYDGWGVHLTTGALTVFFDVLQATEPPFHPFIFADAATGKPRTSEAARRLLRRHGLSVKVLAKEFEARTQALVLESCERRDIYIERGR